ncbi:MAG: winged helix-turn-helix transcriptional regulator [Nitratireductor sp.]
MQVPIPVLREDNIPITHRGSNQSGMRAYNERLVLTLVRRHGSLAKTDIARMTGLSAQTVSVIMRQLEADELLLRGEPMRGRVGQPSVPLSLNPEGAFFSASRSGGAVAKWFCSIFLARLSRG